MNSCSSVELYLKPSKIDNKCWREKNTKTNLKTQINNYNLIENKYWHVFKVIYMFDFAHNTG